MRLALLLLLGVSACGFQVPGGQPGPGDAPDAPSDARPDAPVDAPPDAPPQPPMWRIVETLIVPCDGSVVTSTVVLDTTTSYRLQAAGTCIANTTSSSRADAEYAGWGLSSPVGDVVANVDIGIAIDDTTPGMLKRPFWGAATTSHVYEVAWTGTGAVITAMFHDPDYTNNRGDLTLTILAYQ